MNLLDHLRRDHCFFLDLLEKLDQTVTESSNRYFAEGRGAQVTPDLVTIIEKMLARMALHERAEEGLLFPLLRRFSPDVEPALSVIEADHKGLGRALASFQREAGTAERPTAWMILGISRVTNMMRSHIAREEADLFSAAAQRVPPEELERLGAEAAVLAQYKEQATHSGPEKGEARGRT
ncbi:MAG: hemerythrin domain-containing protein [Elusimicrobia bacterium]|nr:hemerythrin domain-containing protein [Elusimicrobiota bacterium]